MEELIFNTKNDFFNYLTVAPEETRKELQLLLDNRMIWKTTAILDDSEAGQTDDTHRVIGEQEKIQQELIEDSNARIFQLGFTVAEVEELLDND